VIDSFVLLTPLVLLPVVLLPAFVGCVGEIGPILVRLPLTLRLRYEEADFPSGRPADVIFRWRVGDGPWHEQAVDSPTSPLELLVEVDTRDDWREWTIRCRVFRDDGTGTGRLELVRVESDCELRVGWGVRGVTAGFAVERDDTGRLVTRVEECSLDFA
jgi:hypothetical protein